MSDTSYSRWYRDGTVSITKNSTTLTGANTYWLNANIKPGDLFTIDASQFYEVYSVDNNIQITLKTPYLGNTITASTYSIIRNFTATLPAEIAALVTDAVATSRKYIDLDMQTVQGKSAFELAVDSGFVGTKQNWLDSLNAYGVAKSNGYTGTAAQWLESLTAYGVAVKNGYSGTAAQWLESLKAAGEWANAKSILDARGELFFDSPLNHRRILRCKNLGVFTEAHHQSILNGTFDDIYPGDYFMINGHPYLVLDINYHSNFPWGNTYDEATDDPTSDFMNEHFINITASGTPNWDLFGNHIIVLGPLNDIFTGTRNYADGTTWGPSTDGGYLNANIRAGDISMSPVKRQNEVFREDFGKYAVAWKQNLSSAFDNENQVISAWKQVITFGELLDEAHFFTSRMMSEKAYQRTQQHLEGGQLGHIQQMAFFALVRQNEFFENWGGKFGLQGKYISTQAIVRQNVHAQISMVWDVLTHGTWNTDNGAYWKDARRCCPTYHMVY